MICRGWLLLLFVLVSVPSAARFALLIGNASGGKGLERLKFVENDLTAVKATLNTYCGFDKEHIISVSNKGPSDVHEALDRLENLLPLGEDNLLLLYYTGHADREHLKMGNARFPLTAMKKRFSTFPASIRIGIFDACQSGSFTRLKGGQLAEPFLFKDMEKIKGEVILSSSSPTENAQESDLYGNSIFTFHFVNALRGSGDLSGDGKVTLSEAYQYTYNHTVASTARTWGGVQHPSYRFRIQGEGDVILADLTVATQGVLLEGSVAGDVSMFDTSNNIVADLSKEHGSRMIIALNSGIYQIVVGSSNNQKWKTTVSVGQKELVPVQMKQFKKITPVRIQHKGESEERFRIGISLGISYGWLNLSSSARNLQTEFGGFNRFGIEPKFISDGDRVLGSIGIRFRIIDRIAGSFTFTHMQYKRDGHYSGTDSVSNSVAHFPLSLQVSDYLKCSILDWGVGYHFTQPFIRGMLLQVGVWYANIDRKMQSTFTSKELYDVTVDNRYDDCGYLMAPYIAGGYTYTFARYLEATLFARYRYQSSPKKLQYGFLNDLFDSQSKTIHQNLQYTLKGFDVSLAVTINLVWTGGEE